MNDHELLSQNDTLQFAKEVLQIEAEAITNISKNLNKNFYEASQLILDCKGMIVIAGVGKTGLIGEKISATLSSVGIPSITLHPTDALHGDLGRVRSGDILIALSNSGETEEIKFLLHAIKKFPIKTIAITGAEHSSIGQLAHIHINMGKIHEACPLGLAPTASTSAMMAMGDALAMVVVKQRNFTHTEFAQYHPKGNIGFKLTSVKEAMRKNEKLPLIKLGTPMKEVLAVMTSTPGRPGAALIIDNKKHLLGIFTDGNVRRLLQTYNSNFLNDVIDIHMQSDPKIIYEEQSIEEAVNLFRQYVIDQVPVLNTENEVVGLLDVQDII